MHILSWLISGFLAGWLVGFVARGRGYGPAGDLAVGVLGGLLGGFLLHMIHGGPEVTGWPAHFMAAVIGGFVLVVLVRGVRRLLGVSRRAAAR